MSNIIEKTNILRKEFLECELVHDGLCSREELLAVLDRKARRPFDRDVAHQLFERMSGDPQRRVTVDEFIKVWLQAEAILQQKCEASKRSLLEFHKQRKEAVHKLEVLKMSTPLKESRLLERVNQYGVMQDSKLAVRLVSGSQFPAVTFYGVLKLGAQEFETPPVQGPNPKWERDFEFAVQTGLEELHLYFVSSAHAKNPLLLGTVTIALSRLHSQNQIEDVYDLFDKGGA